MTIWHDDVVGELRANFPPPEGYVGIEEGEFGDEDYERTLDATKDVAWEAARAEACAPCARRARPRAAPFSGFPTRRTIAPTATGMARAAAKAS